MRLRPLLLIIFLCLLLPETHALTSPPATITPAAYTDSASIIKITSLSVKEVQRLTGRKMNFLQKLQLKILQKKLKKSLRHEENKTSKDTISTIALITGIAGLVLLFLVPIAGFLLIITAIITGIIGLNNNDNPKSRTKALIGLVTALAGIALLLIALVIFASGGLF